MSGDDHAEMSEDDDRPSSSAYLGRSTSAATPQNRSSATSVGGEVLENVLEDVLCFLTSRRDRNAASLVCKSWYRAEALTRSEVFIGNCYAVSPRLVTGRFGRVKSMVIKGKPRFADFRLLPAGWGAHFGPWITAMAGTYHALEKVCLKRMSVTNDDLSVLAYSFPNFRELVLVFCEGFGTSGLAIVARECRKLRVLDLIESDVTDDKKDWISCFPQNETCLESLLFECVECPVSFEALERLVARSPSLRRLKLNRFVSIGQLYHLMFRAPQLTHLGTGLFGHEDYAVLADQEPDYAAAFAACKSIVYLSGFKEIDREYLTAIFPVCDNLTSLNFGHTYINTQQLKSVIFHCHKLQVFWVLDSVGDEGLQAVAAICKDLRELRVFPAVAREDIESPVSYVGLQAISEGCRKLESILYFCQQMTNAAVIAMSKNCPSLVVFRLCIMGRGQPDHLTGEPMDEGFGAIVKNCKKLTRLSVSGLLTDKAFGYIGQYGKLVRTLSVAFAGDSDLALTYVLLGCPNLQKLEIRDCPFGDSALLAGLHHYYNMRFLWMSSCKVTRRGCEEVARQLPRLILEVFNWGEHENGDADDFVGTLYMYPSLEGPRNDAPRSVHML